MIRHLKKARNATGQHQASAEIRKTVETMIADIATRGEEALRDLSQRLDRWAPESFRLSKRAIEAAIAGVPRG